MQGFGKRKNYVGMAKPKKRQLEPVETVAPVETNAAIDKARAMPCACLTPTSFTACRPTVARCSGAEGGRRGIQGGGPQVHSL